MHGYGLNEQMVSGSGLIQHGPIHVDMLYMVMFQMKQGKKYNANQTHIIVLNILII